MKIKKIGVFIFVMIFAFLFLGCSSKDDGGDSKKEAQKAADDVVNAINQDLVAKDQTNALFALSPEQLAVFKTCQSSEVQKANLSSSNETGKAVAGIVKGTLIALGRYSNEELGGASSDTKESSKVEIVKVVNQKIMDILKNKPGTQTFSNSIKTVFANIVANFDSSGLTQTNLIAAVGELAINTLSHAKTIGLNADAIAAVAIDLIKSGVSSLGSGGAGLLDKLVPEATEKITAAIVEGLQSAGVGNDAIVAKIADIVDAAVVALGDVPDLPPEELGLSIKSVEKGISKGLEKIGLNGVQITAQEDSVKDAVTDAVKKLADKDTALSSPDKVLTLSVEGAKGLVDHISAKLFSIDSTTGLELSETQIKKIKEDIQKKVDATTDYKLESIAPLVFEEAKKSIKQILPPLSDREKIDALKTVVEGSVAYLGGKVADQEFGDKDLRDSLQIIAQNSINPLLKDMTGDTGVFREMAKALIEPLDLVPMGNTSIADAARVVVEGIISNIDNVGLSESDQSAALSNTLNGAVKAAQKGKFTLEQLKEAEGKIAAGATESLIKNQEAKLKESLKAGAGDATADATADRILEGVADQVMDSMKEAGALDVPKLADDVIEGAFDALKKDNDPQTEDLSTQQVAKALDKVAKGVEKSLVEDAKADDNQVDSEEKAKIDEAVDDMSKKADELLAQLTPPGAPNLVLSAGAISANEDSTAGKAIGVVLDAPPEKNVVVSIESQDTDQGTVSPATLTFGVDNWFVPQEVKITSVHNGMREGNITYPVTFTTDSGARKTVMVTDIDDDVVGLHITPFGEQLYTAAYGAPVTFKVRLMSKPFDEIEVNWAMVEGKEKPDGKDPAAVTKGKIMTFAPAAWYTYQDLVVEPATLDISEHVGVSFSSLVVKAKSDKDHEYPAMDVQTMAMVVLKALKLEKFELDPASSDSTTAVIKVTFKDDLFVNKDKELDEDVKLTYEKGMLDQTFDMIYPVIQTEPQCISTKIEVINDTTDNNVEIVPKPGSGFDFSVAFYNTTTESAEIAVAKWLDGKIQVDATTGPNICQGDASTVITCNYTGANVKVDGFTLLPNSLFSPAGIGNTTATPTTPLNFSDTGPETPSGPPSNPDPSTDLKIRFKYSGMVDGEKKMVTFKSLPGQRDTTGDGIKLGFWVLDSWSANLSKVKISTSDAKGLELETGPEPYGSERYHYIKIE